MAAHPADLNGFEAVYRRHVGLVVAGDFSAVLEDMDPASMPSVFNGVDAPRGDVEDAEIVSVRLEGDRAVGEAVYTVPDRRIGLRSGWHHNGTTWKAHALENFAVSEAS